MADIADLAGQFRTVSGQSVDSKPPLFIGEQGTVQLSTLSINIFNTCACSGDDLERGNREGCCIAYIEKFRGWTPSTSGQ